MRAFDQAGNIGDDEGLVADLDHAEIRTERRKWIIGDLGTRGTDRREQRRFTRVWEADQPDIGDYLKLKIKLALLPRRAKLGNTRHLMRRGRKMRVAEPSLAALCSQKALAGRDEIDGVGLAFNLRAHKRARRNLDNQILAVTSVFARRTAVAAALGFEALIESKAEERIKLRIDLEDDIATTPAVPAIGKPVRDILLAPEGSETISASSSFDR